MREDSTTPIVHLWEDIHIEWMEPQSEKSGKITIIPYVNNISRPGIVLTYDRLSGFKAHGIIGFEGEEVKAGAGKSILTTEGI